MTIDKRVEKLIAVAPYISNPGANASAKHAAHQFAGKLRLAMLEVACDQRQVTDNALSDLNISTAILDKIHAVVLAATIS
jgi:hypothetical protein